MRKIILVLIVMATSFASASSRGNTSSAVDSSAPFRFCEIETKVSPDSNRSSLNSRSCYAGANYIVNYPESTSAMTEKFCSGVSVKEICLQAVWAYRRSEQGETPAYAKTIQFSEGELGFERGARRSLNSISLFYGADSIENEKGLSDTQIKSTCDQQPVPEKCMQAMWAYRRAIQGESAKFGKTERYCAALTGVKRGSGKYSLNSLSCYFGLDFIESHPSADSSLIQTYESYAPVSKMYLDIIQFYQDMADSSLPINRN